MITIRTGVAPVLSSLSLSLVLFGCGKGKKSDQPVPVATDKHEVPVASIEESEGLLREAYVNCDNPAKCHPSVGMLAVATSSAVSTCTAWLVSDDIIATNSHCIPSEMRDAPTACQGHMRVLFPRVASYGPMQASCMELLESSDYGDTDGNEVSQDYAFVRLTHSVARPAIEIDRGGFADDDKVTIAKIDPYTGVIGGNLTSVECQVTQSSMLLPSVGNDAPFVVMAGCETYHGNSGSPILDTSGRARGIYHILVNKDEMKKAFANLLQGDVEPMAIGTNLRCVQSHWVQGIPSLSPGCKDIKKVLFKGLRDPQNGLEQKLSKLGVEKQITAEAALRANLSHWLEADAVASRLEWDVRTIEEKGQGYRVVPTPKCLKSSLEWLRQYRRGFLGRKYEQSATSTLAVPTIQLKINVNARLEIGIAQSEVSTKPYALELSPDEIKKTSQVLPRKDVNVIWNGERTSIPFCDQ